MKRPQTDFPLMPWLTSKLLGQKKSKIITRMKFIITSNFSCSKAFSLLYLLMLPQ